MILLVVIFLNSLTPLTPSPLWSFLGCHHWHTSHTLVQLQQCNETTVAWLEWYLSSLMPCLFSPALSIQWECVECCDWCVFLCACVFRDTPSPKLGMQVFLCVSLLHLVTHFPSLTLFFLLLLPLFMSACFLLLHFFSFSLLPQGLCAFLPGGAEVSVIQAR